jgi:hypothetical protein
MWAATPLFLQTLTRSHTQSAYVEILKNGVRVAIVQGSYTDPMTNDKLYLIDGNITVDKTTIRRSGSITFLNPAGQLIPHDAGDLLAPYATELRVWVGVRYWTAPLAVPLVTGASAGQIIGGTPQSEFEYVPVGTLVITDIDTSNYPQITCQGYDRSWFMSSFTSPTTVPAGTDAATAISQLLQASVPATVLVTNFPTTDYTIPATTFDANSSVADAAQQIAASAGLEFYADPVGVFQLSPQPTTDDPPVLTLQPAPNSAILRPRRTFGEGVGQMYNAVVFTGEGGTTTPVQGYAEDDNPSSATYVGTVGVRPFFDSSPAVSTTDQANQAAVARLQAIQGVANQILIPILPNPALESGDVVHILDSAQSLDEMVIVDTFTVALRAGAGTQLLTCRSNVSS